MRSALISVFMASALAAVAVTGQGATPAGATDGRCSSSSPTSEMECWDAARLQVEAELSREVKAAELRYMERARVPNKDQRDALVLTLHEFGETYVKWLKNRAQTCKAIVDQSLQLEMNRCIVVLSEARIQEMKSLPFPIAPESGGAR
jgi:uncharacterized protein YecT (DUF1311 family)